MRNLGVLIALFGAIACDDDNPARHLDGGTVDSSMQVVDAPVTPQPVSVTIKSDGIGQEGVVVHFQNADSTLVATETTDATGTASHLMNAGGYVTAIDPFPQPVPTGLPPQGPRHDVRSFVGVKPGDHLRIEEGSSATPVTVTVTLPPQTDGNIAYYSVSAPCGGDTLLGTGSGGSDPSGTVSFYGCGATTDILVVARDQAFQPLNYFFVADQPLMDNGTIDYSTKTFQGLATRTYSFGAQPASVPSSFSVEQHVGTIKGELDSFTGNGSGDPVTASVSFPNIPNGVGGVQVMASTANMQHIAFDWGGLSTTAFSIDFGVRMLTEATNVAFDPATHAITWTEGSGVAPDFATVEMSGYRNTTDSQRIDWKLIGPYTGSLKLPTLPVGTFDLNYMSTDTPTVDLMGIGKMPGGYDSVRPLFFAVDNPLAITSGASGSAQFAIIGGGGNQAVRAKTAAKKKALLQHRTQSTH
jgi:hypothetical protein